MKHCAKRLLIGHLDIMIMILILYVKTKCIQLWKTKIWMYEDKNSQMTWKNSVSEMKMTLLTLKMSNIVGVIFQ